MVLWSKIPRYFFGVRKKSREHPCEEELRTEFLIQRIREYRADFAIYCYSCFNAFARLKKWEIRYKRIVTIINTLALVLSILTITSFVSEWGLSITTMLGFIAIVLNLSSLLVPSKENSLEYFVRAEKVNMLWKKSRDLENLIKAGVLSKEEIAKELLYFQSEAEKNALTPLYIAPEDYEKARKQLAQGQKSYTSEDLNL